jgi:hypothetical protein
MLGNGQEIRLPDHIGSSLASNMQSVFTLGTISCKESWRTGSIGACAPVETIEGAGKRQAVDVLL